MDADSEFYDEIAERLTVIYNQMHGIDFDLGVCEKNRAALQAKKAALEAKASHYEALFASDNQGITA